jgi:ABC-type Zn2+ transport system substrate-binding protein/surface adhesin
MDKARDGVFLVTTKKTDDDEGDHEHDHEDADEHEDEHEDESEWDITLKNGPGLALQGAEAQEGKVTFGSAVRES